MTETGSGRRIGRPTLDEAVALRELFLKQALVMLLERGVHGFSMDALAKASGVTKRTIYRQYESKAVLIEAVVDREVNRLTVNEPTFDDAPTTPLDRLQKWGWRFFSYLSQEEPQRLGLLLRIASRTETWANDMLKGIVTRLLNSVHVLVVAAQESGDLREGDSHVLVELMLDLLDGAFNSIRYDVGMPSAFRSDELEKQFQRRWMAFLQLARPDWMAPRGRSL